MVDVGLESWVALPFGDEVAEDLYAERRLAFRIVKALERLVNQVRRAVDNNCSYLATDRIFAYLWHAHCTNDCR